MYQPKEIIIHCSAYPPNWKKDFSTKAKVEAIREDHINRRGWSDIGYHHLIDRDGTLAVGRPWNKTGAHVRGRNTGTRGVCLLGGKGSNENDDFFDHFTQEQFDALENYLQSLLLVMPHLKFSGHNEYAAKACPGFQVKDFLMKANLRGIY